MKVIVIGGGASGMLCAILQKRQGNDVTLIEKNEKLIAKVNRLKKMKHKNT